MAIFLLHLRSRINLDHIEANLDDLEQRILPDAHYVLSREGSVANYLVVLDQDPADFYSYIIGHSDGLLADQLSLVELGGLSAGFEHGCDGRPATDFCGEWHLRRNEESFQMEEIRVRTGVHKWLLRHRRGHQSNGQATALFLYLNQDLPETSGWLDRLRNALGTSCRPHMRDRRTILLTWSAPSPPYAIIRSPQVKRYLDDRIHTALCFALGGRKRHTAGALQSVFPTEPAIELHEGGGRQVGMTPTIVASQKHSPYSARLEPALEALRRAGRARNEGSGA